jgi:hypothetical protein
VLPTAFAVYFILSRMTQKGRMRLLTISAACLLLVLAVGKTYFEKPKVTSRVFSAEESAALTKQFKKQKLSSSESNDTIE